MSTLPDSRPRPASDLLFGVPAPAAPRPAPAGAAPGMWTETPAAARDAAPTYCAWPPELLAAD
jgi:hypothetical protein